jgi:hypothetical protein
MADIFVSYTNKDREWADWIGHELDALGHAVHIDSWEVSGGQNIMAWMEERHHKADPRVVRGLGRISDEAILQSRGSRCFLRRGAGEGARSAATRRNFGSRINVEQQIAALK